MALNNAPVHSPPLRTRLGAHVEACRPDTLFYIGLVALAGVLLSRAEVPPWQIAAAWAAVTLGWIASLYGGDYFDRELDATAKPQRPLPSGRMTPREAFAGMMTAIVVGLVLAIAVNPWNVALGAVAVVLGVSYSRQLKARGLWGNLARGGPTAMAFLLGATAAGQFPSPQLVGVAAVLWLHDSASNIIGTLCDVDGDRAGGYLTVPVRYGDRAALAVLACFTVTWIALTATIFACLATTADRLASGPFFAASALLTVVSLVILVRGGVPVRRRTALRSHEVVVWERLVLACAFIAASGRWGAAAVALTASLAATSLAQRWMRARYEPGRRGW